MIIMDIYIVCDEGNSSTLQIIDISNLPNSVTTVYDSDSLFQKSHNIFIDTYIRQTICVL